MNRFSIGVGALALAGIVAVACGGGTSESGTQTATGDVQVTLTTEPDPPTMGETTFEATVTAGAQPVTDADVSVELFMPAMPEMKMAEMRSSVPLTHEGGGRYRGAGNVMMAGRWEATVRVRRGAQELGARTIPLTAK
jgi:hypothetical protein